MRDPGPVLEPVLNALDKAGLRSDQAALLCDVELGLRLHERLNPGDAVGAAWVLFCGIPYARGRGLVTSDEAATALRSARFSLWTLRRRTAWHDALATYQALDGKVRAFEVPCPDARIVRLPTEGIADDRFTWYDRLLATAPPFRAPRRASRGKDCTGSKPAGRRSASTCPTLRTSPGPPDMTSTSFRPGAGSRYR
jgi:hypothetical protein